MTKYKVGDVAALFSKPKSPTSTGGKKLQSLFEDYYSKKSKPVFHSQKEENLEVNRSTEIVEVNNSSSPKKSRKRKFSSNDSELNENVFSKKFKESSEQEGGSKSNENRKFKKFGKQQDFPRKTNKNSELNENVFSKKFNESFKQESFKSNENRKFKKFGRQQDFPRKSNKNSELSENVFSKKFNESSEQEGFKSNKNRKFKKFGKQQDFPRKNSNDSELNVFSKKFKRSFEQEESSKINVNKEWNKQHESPRKNKKSKVNLLNTSSTFPKFEAENISENGAELPLAYKLQNVPKDNKQSKNFIKKSKKRSLNYNSNKFSSGGFCKDSYDSDDTSLKNEIKEFMRNNSLNEKMEGSNNVKQEKTFNCKGQDSMKKTKKKYLTNEVHSPQKCEESLKQDNKTNKKINKNYNNQQDIPRNKKKSKTNSFNFGNTESEIKHDNVEQDSLLKKSNSAEKKDKKQSKKPKHELNDTNASNFLASENNSATNTSKINRMDDFIRKPKNKKGQSDTLSTNHFENSSSKAIDNRKPNEHFKHKEFNVNNTMQVKVPGIETLDFIKLPHSDEENNENNFEERLSRTLFVGNLPTNMSKQELKNLFSAFGAIRSVRLTGIETDKAKIFGKNPRKLLHTNYASDTIPGFVEFKDRQCAVQALKLSGSVFKGHHITVDFALPAGTQKIYDDKQSIFIGNLPFEVKDESIWNAFSDCGRIEGVRVVRDRETGLGKGFGYVLFSTVEAKENALGLDNLHIEGRDIRIKAVNSNKKAQKSKSSAVKRDTFKSRAIRMKKNKVSSGRKSIRKLTNKEKTLHNKKKIASILQKAMK